MIVDSAGQALELALKEGVYLIKPNIREFRELVGAGDSMVAGTVLSLAQGKNLRDSVLFGIAAGAAAVMTPGTELCRREDVERLYDQMAFE